MPCSQHSGGIAVDGCEACTLVDKAAGWLAWLEHRIDELDAEAVSVAERLETATASRDDIAHHLEHGTMTPSLLLELIGPFTQPAASSPTAAKAPAHAHRDARNGVRTATRSTVAGRAVPPGVAEGLPGRVRVDGMSGDGEGRHLAPPSSRLALNLPHASAGAVLSATGALLVLVAAIVFTAVSWGRLGEGGRVGAMLGFLAVSAIATIEAHRRRMRWTAEALAWLTASLAAVEMAAVTAFDIMIRVDTVPVTVLLVSMSFLAMSVLVAALSRGGTTALAQPWQGAPIALAMGVAAWSAGMGHDAERVWWSPIVAATGVLLAVVSPRVRQSTWWVSSAIVAWAAACLWSLIALDGSWTRLVGAVLTTSMVVGTAAVALRRHETPAVLAGAAASTLMLAAVPAFNFRLAGTVAVDVSLGVLGVLAVAAAWGGVTGRVDRRGAAAAALPLAGTALVALDRAPTGAVALGLLALVAGMWAWRTTGVARAASAAMQWAALLLWSGYFAHALGLPSAWSGAVVAASSAVVAAGAIRRRVSADAATGILDPAHYVAVGLAGAGALAAGGNHAAFAVSTAVVAVAAAALLDRPAVRHAALALGTVSLSLSWVSLMDAVEVSVVEAYTLPVGAVVVAGGERARRWWPRLTSWVLAPGLAIAALGTMSGVAADREGVTRWVSLLICGAGVAAIGGRWRLQAPLLIGTAATVFAALSQLGPWAVGLPRWLTIGTVGAALLVAGARFEAVRTGVRRASTALRQLH